MKKFYLSALGCLMAMGASAQKLDQVGTMQGEFWSLKSIPTEYAYNGKSSVYTVGETESGVEFTVYNKLFEVDRTIKVANPTSYSRLELGSREQVTGIIGIYELDCGNYIPESYYSFPYWWSVYKYPHGTHAYTDEYVEEWVAWEYGGNLNIIEKIEYNGGVLFVRNHADNAMYGWYFKENKLMFVEVDIESEVIVYSEEKLEYYAYYNRKTAEFTQENIIEYINEGLDLYFTDGIIYGYRVDSVEEKKDGCVVFYTNIYHCWNEFGEQYPRLKFIWDQNMNTLIAEKTEYGTTYTGEWRKSLIESDYDYEDASDWIWDATIMPFYVGKIMGEVYEEDGIIASQTLFNNDEKWEFLRPVFAEFADYDHYETREEDRDGDGEIDYKQTKYRDKLKAYEVVSENGNVLTTITVPEGEYYAPLFINWDGETFFGIAVEKKIEEDEDDYYEEYIAVYNIDKNASSVKKIAETPAMRVSPALANRNSTVNVTLDAETAKNGGELVITDSNGRAIARRRVEVGQTSVPVTTDRMSSGVYNITLTEKGQKVENARIIVK